MKLNSSQKPDTIWDKFKSFIMETDIRVLTFSPAVVCLIVIFTWAFVSGKILRLNNPLPYTSILVGLSFLLASSVGVIQIIRREVPGPLGNPIKGVYAIISEVLFALGFGAGGLIALIIGFQLLFSK